MVLGLLFVAGMANSECDPAVLEDELRSTHEISALNRHVWVLRRSSIKVVTMISIADEFFAIQHAEQFCATVVAA